MVTNVAVATTGSGDPQTQNNSAAVVLTVANPAPVLVTAGALLVTESGPVNGTVDPGETVTVTLALKNVGSADSSANLTAQLLASGGVTAPSGPQTYGQMAVGGAAVTRSFTFTADPNASTAVVATLALTDGTTDLGTVSYTFLLPVTQTFSNPNTAIIPNYGIASIYPMITTVSGLTGLVDKVRVKLNGVSHSFPNDINVLLAGPQGNTVLLMSHTGGGHPITNLDLAFDSAATAYLPKTAALSSGVYLPTRYDTAVAFLPPAPAGPYGLGLDSLNGTDPNGQWALYVMDDSNGDSGSIAGGYTLEISVVEPVNPVADLGLSLVSTPDTVFVGSLVTNYLTVSNQGPDNALNVMVTNLLAAGVNFISGSATQGTVAGTNESAVVAQLGTIAAGSSATVTIVSSPYLGGTVVNRATVSSSSLDLQPANNAAQTTVSVYGVIPSTLTGSIGNGQFNLEVTGQPGLTYEIQVSSSLSTWTAISTNVAPPSGVIKVSDPLVTGPAARFYRSVRVSP